METPLEDRLNELVPRMVKKLETVITLRIDKARFKKTIIEEELMQLNHVFMYFFKSNSFVEKQIITFCENYSRGVPIDNQVQNLILGKKRKVNFENGIKQKLEITSSYQLEEIKFYNYIQSPEYIIGCFARFISIYKTIKIFGVKYEEIQEKYQCYFGDQTYKNSYNQYYYLTDEQLVSPNEKIVNKVIDNSIVLVNDNTPRIKWTGSKNDLYKLVYSLHELKLINDGEGDITKIIPVIGHILGVEIKGSWQSSFSQHRNSNNNDYNHFELFDNLKESYNSILNKK